MPNRAKDQSRDLHGQFALECHARGQLTLDDQLDHGTYEILSTLPDKLSKLRAIDLIDVYEDRNKIYALSEICDKAQGLMFDYGLSIPDDVITALQDVRPVWSKLDVDATLFDLYGLNPGIDNTIVINGAINAVHEWALGIVMSDLSAQQTRGEITLDEIDRLMRPLEQLFKRLG